MIPLYCVQSNALFPIKQVMSLDLLDGTTESPPEVPHKSRRTLMSPQECEIAWCSQNQIEMTTNFPVLASEQCPVHHHTAQLAGLPLGNTRDSLRTRFKSIGTPISAQEFEESSMHPILSREES